MKLWFHGSFKKSFEKMPEKTRTRFEERLRVFQADKFDPSLQNHSVDKVYPGCRSINVTGDYRAIFYEIGDVAVFTKIGRHAQLYK